jgi:hypothetical protein
MRRCAATTIAGTRCKHKISGDLKYCTFHHRLIAEQADVGQTAAFHGINESTGMFVELWKLIANDFNLNELRVMMLVCKALLALFANDSWYKEHPRYLLVHDRKEYPVPSKYQDAVSKRMTTDKRRKRYITFYFYPYEGFVPLIFVVNSYLATREVYRILHLGGRIVFDASADTFTVDAFIAHATNIACIRAEKIIRKGKRKNILRYSSYTTHLLKLEDDIISLINDRIVKLVIPKYPSVKYTCVREEKEWITHFELWPEKIDEVVQEKAEANS